MGGDVRRILAPVLFVVVPANPVHFGCRAPSCPGRAGYSRSSRIPRSECLGFTR
jgi:hypothetical protein